MSYPPHDRKLRGENPVSFSEPAIRYSNADVSERASAEVSRVLSDRGMSAKEAAREVGCSPRTVENIIQGRNGISVETLREMSRRFPELRPAIRAFFFLEAELDADTERMLAKIMALAARKS
jgi:transcriptional regulator with XRE-family HTH domain